MLEILQRLKRIALRRAQQEFQRYNETWNQPYPLLGAGVAFGLVGAALCQIITMFAVVVLAWEIRHDPEFWLIVVAAAFSYGAIPGMALGLFSGIAQALCWTKRSRLASLVCLAGGTLMLARTINLIVKLLQGAPDWRIDVWYLLLLFCASLIWALLLLIYGLRLTRAR
jgi:hypothetical protein